MFHKKQTNLNLFNSFFKDPSVVTRIIEKPLSKRNNPHNECNLEYVTNLEICGQWRRRRDGHVGGTFGGLDGGQKPRKGKQNNFFNFPLSRDQGTMSQNLSY